MSADRAAGARRGAADTSGAGPSAGRISASGAPPDKHPARIAGMFDAIARRYDLLNHLLSGGLDVYWRARAVRTLDLAGTEVVLDLCTGTCDLALAALRARPAGARRVVGLDFAGEMLRIGQRKIAAAGLRARAPLVRGDAMRLPLADASVDGAMVAFGIRNVQDASTACAEIGRVLRPGGRFAVLEFSLPRSGLVRRLYAWYFRKVLPAVGRLVSRHRDAYSYLPASVGAFATPAEFSGVLAGAGFSAIRTVPLTLGIVHLHVAVKTPAR